MNAYLIRPRAPVHQRASRDFYLPDIYVSRERASWRNHPVTSRRDIPVNRATFIHVIHVARYSPRVDQRRFMEIKRGIIRSVGINLAIFHHRANAPLTITTVHQLQRIEFYRDSRACNFSCQSTVRSIGADKRTTRAVARVHSRCKTRIAESDSTRDRLIARFLNRANPRHRQSDGLVFTSRRSIIFNERVYGTPRRSARNARGLIAAGRFIRF